MSSGASRRPPDWCTRARTSANPCRRSFVLASCSSSSARRSVMSFRSSSMPSRAKASSSCKWRPISSSDSLAARTRGCSGAMVPSNVAVRSWGVNQTVLQPTQRRMRVEQTVRRGRQPAWIVLGFFQNVEQFAIGLFRRRRSRGSGRGCLRVARRNALSLLAISCIERNSARSLPRLFSAVVSRLVAVSRSLLARATVLVNSSIMLLALASRRRWNSTCRCL